MKGLLSSIIKALNNLPKGQKNQQLLIGCMCFCWSCSTLMVFSFLPIYLKEELQVTHEDIGMVEAVAVSLAFLAKSLMGGISDITKKRKPILVLGNMMTLISKSIFLFAGSFIAIFSAKALDRFSKGVRSAPTDALISDWSTPDNRGISYGIRQSFYTMGVVFGSIAASTLFKYSAGNYKLVFTCSVIPAAIALFISLIGIKDAPEPIQKKSWSFREVTLLPKRFWYLMLCLFFLMCAHFGDSFLTLRAREIGVEKHHAPLLFLFYSFVHSVVAIPIGYLADRYNRLVLFLVGLGVLCVANNAIVMASSTFMIMISYGLFGLHLGIVQGLIATLIGSCVGRHIRGTAFGIYYIIVSIAIAVANSCAGYFSDKIKSASGAFQYGLIPTAICVFLVLIFRKELASYAYANKEKKEDQ